ncbi:MULTISPECIES: sialate O-acetylesterase [Bacteroides]|uniref:sialate O-acetylesterase n=1 Tax=Bacteroides TaxID=816 RepID=UPI00189CF084|nr:MULTISPECIES: sialate O-acetylesterase [Bacteroides]MDC2612779.1 sialate O-acetylesterase [Bacteroides ovatus]MDC2631757.1 sialate O-acetylesterase [Bacteroides ovatus]
MDRFKKYDTFFLVIFCLLISQSIRAEIKLPGYFTDNMMLQRDMPIKIWGWGNRYETVTVSIHDQKVNTRCKKDGTWEIILSPIPYGGPYSLTVQGKENSIKIENILIGDIWLCSGQSNMEWTVEQSANSKQEVQNANYPEIRALKVPKSIKNSPQDNFNAQWEICSPSTVGAFSGIAYYYARALYKEVQIPIGIINASWGGTDIETWISDEAFTALPSNVQKQYNMEVVNNLEEYIRQNKGQKQAFLDAMENDPGINNQWFIPGFNTVAWEEMRVPGEWGTTPLSLIDGHVWFKYDLNLTCTEAGRPATLSLGTIDDADITWVNGTKVGNASGWDTPRIYSIPPGILKEGSNNITVRVTDNGGSGGMWGQEADIYLEIDNTRHSLAGNWKYQMSVANADYHVLDITPNMVHSSLYNTMIHPLTPFRIKGVIWYQGENNVGAGYDYRTLFQTQIKDWRTRWGYELPFYWVQLANLYPEDTTPVESSWAELRESQAMTLELPHTGQATIYDIGDAYSIHPTNKQEVGRRLSLIALHKDYGRDSLVYSGPTFQNVSFKENTAVITMNTYGSQLTIHNKYGYLEGFSIAGEDRKFVWAKAFIDANGKIIVYNENIAEPVAVRYAWSNNPAANLFNAQGLPAIPFRTDSWKGVTEK